MRWRVLWGDRLAAPGLSVTNLGVDHCERLAARGVVSVSSLPTQDQVNRRVYHARGVTRHYAEQTFETAEVMTLMRYQSAFVGRDVLDIGVGTGRTSRCLSRLAKRYVGVDYSPAMVEYVSAALPEVEVSQVDVRDLSAFPDACFDSAFATNNVLDALSHEDRLLALAGIRRVLRPGGLLTFSSHNRLYARAWDGPQLVLSMSALRTVRETLRWMRRMRNHLRIKKLRRSEDEYALINDIGHDYACLHYYIEDTKQQAQLQDCGFQLIELASNDGRVFQPGSSDTSGDGWLMYVARVR